jgi:hypothetical protein
MQWPQLVSTKKRQLSVTFFFMMPLHQRTISENIVTYFRHTWFQGVCGRGWGCLALTPHLKKSNALTLPPSNFLKPKNGIFLTFFGQPSRFSQICCKVSWNFLTCPLKFCLDPSSRPQYFWLSLCMALDTIFVSIMIQLMAKPEDFLNTLRFLTTLCWSDYNYRTGPYIKQNKLYLNFLKNQLTCQRNNFNMILKLLHFTN